jgi:hypothetical protein
MEALANVVTARNDCKGLHFLLTQDLRTFNIINFSICTKTGYTSNAFNGHFDGGGHEIELNLPYGLFYLGSSGLIENLVTTGTVSSLSGENGGDAGGIAYYCAGTIRSCINKATVNANSFFNLPSIGGIAGKLVGGSITNCYNVGEIKNFYEFLPNTAYCGGIVGRINGGSVSNCYNTGDLIAYGGGIFDDVENNGKIENCFVADAEILHLGGRIGSVGRGITNCYATPSVKVNGAPVIGSNTPNGYNGADASVASLQSGSWLAQNLGWNFTTVWKARSGRYPTLIYDNSNPEAAEPSPSFEWAFSLSPARDYLYVTSPKPVQKAEIFTVTGQQAIVATAAADGGIDISALSPGVYFIRIYAGDEAASKKFVLRR